MDGQDLRLGPLGPLGRRSVPSPVLPRGDLPTAKLLVVEYLDDVAAPHRELADRLAVIGPAPDPAAEAAFAPIRESLLTWASSTTRCAAASQVARRSPRWLRTAKS